MPETADIRATRKHKILSDRNEQLRRNLMAKAGGGAYITARLSRFPCESDASWNGDGSGIQGRPDRSFLINYAGRIVTKVNQYVFGQDVGRNNVDETFAADATRTGLTVDEFMQNVSGNYTAGQWDWIGVDRGTPGIDPATGQPATRSVAQREAEGDRIFWTLWKSTEVVDWHFGQDGRLVWLITQESVYENDDPATAAVEKVIRTVWERGKGTRLYLDPDDPEKVVQTEDFTISAKLVPFVPVGVPSSMPYWFDDVERVQAALLNLESAHHENLIQTVFPQLVITTDLVDEVMRLSDRSYDESLEMVRGIEYPLMETKESAGITRYLTPAAGDLKAIPDEILRRRKELFEIVGLALGKSDSGQVESAESKAWDHLDPAATLRTRAILLEDVEKKAIGISRELDSTFAEYEPEYPRQFNLVDVAQDMKTLVELSALELPRSAIRESMRISVEIMDQIRKIPDDRKAEILKEIDEMDDATLDKMTAPPAVQVVQGNTGDQADPDAGAAFDADDQAE